MIPRNVQITLVLLLIAILGSGVYILLLHRNTEEGLRRGSDQRPVPSLTDSLDRMVDAAQKVVGDEVSLLGAELSSAFTGALHSGALLLLGTALLAIGWAVVMMAAFEVLAPRLGALATLVVLASVNLLGGGILLVASRRRLKEIGHG